jgi:hypothetical protein
MQAEMSLNKKEYKMSYDNGFQSKESGSSHYPGEEHYYLGEKIKPQPTFYRRYVWQILVGVLIMLVLVIASFTAGLLIRQEQVTVIRKVLTIAPTQPQIEPTQIPTPAPPTSVKLLLSAPRIASTGKSVVTIPSGTTVRLTVVPDHSLLPFQIYNMGIYATDPYGFSELQDCTYPNTATCSYVVAYSSSENTDYTKGQHTFRAFLGNIGGTILTNSNSITIIWS